MVEDDLGAKMLDRHGTETSMPALLTCVLPPGLELRGSRHGGHGLFATRHFQPWEVIYRATTRLVAADGIGPLRLHIRSSESHFPIIELDIDMVRHTTRRPDTGLRYLHTFDSFMNHSCEPNTVVAACGEDEGDASAPPGGDSLRYEVLAAVAIDSGEELTCDYTLADYDARDKEMDPCLCGTPSCLGKVLGFKYLPLEVQVDRLGRVADYLLAAFKHDHHMDLRVIDVNAGIPPGVHVSLSPASPPRVTATRAYRAGELCYTGTAVLLPAWCRRLVLLVEGRGLLLDPIEYYTTSTTHATTSRGRGTDAAEEVGRMAWSWDALMAHSCDANTERVLLSVVAEEVGGAYECRARRDIEVGEDLTVDYEALGGQRTGAMVVRCRCGAAICRGTR